jgi:periplasmic protein TonB
VQADDPGDPAGLVSDTAGGVIGFDGGVADVTIEPPPPAPRQPSPPLRVGSTIRAPQKVHHVAPVYPPIAQSARITGVVILEAIIAEDGTVGMVTVLRSVRFLDDAAVQAVRQWRFTPTLLNGRPVPVIMTVTVSFGLK